ncbi:MAG: cation diffusion facilitator family transporter [Halobacteriales archaeon]
MAAGSTKVVLAAMLANGAIAVLKFVGFLLTGSPSMLAETYHSISDTGNQVLLLVGIFYSRRSVSRVHPFGYGKAQFFYAFLVSVMLFGVAGWESLNHGIEELQAGGHPFEAGEAELFGFTVDIDLPVEPYWVAVAILFGGIVFETYAFWTANRELRRQMRAYGWSSYREAFRRTSDLTTLTAFTEDLVALLGLVLALGGITAARVTGDPIYDAVGAIVIGVLLMGFAIALAIENKRLILGESLPRPLERELAQTIVDHAGVDDVEELRSMFIGTDRVLVTAEVRFEVTGEPHRLDETIDSLDAALRAVDDRIRLVYIEPA